MTKSDVKKFLDTHRDIELSAARFEYSLHLYRGGEEFMFEEANKILPRSEAKQESIDRMIDEASSPDAIVKLLTYLWFLRAYMFSAAVIWFVHRYLKDSVAAYLAVLAVLLVLPDWLNTETWKFTYVFFVSGYLWNVHQVPKRISNFQKHKIITSVILALLFIVLFQFYNADSFVYTTGMTIRSVEQAGTDLYRFLIGFIGSGMVLWLVYITYDRIPETVKRAFLYLGRISLSIYITDVIITDFFMPRLTYGFHLNYAVVLAQTFIMLAVCIAVDYLIGRIPVARRLLLGGR